MPPLGYVIKSTSIRDVHTIRRLEIAIFEKDAYSYLNISTLLMWPGSANFKLLDNENTMVGFVAGTPNYTTHVDWIVTLGVLTAHQGRGLGRWLLQTAEAAMSQERLRLTVRVSNAPAIHLYQTAGYLQTHIEPHYYSDGEDGIVMEKLRYSGQVG